MQLYPAIDIKGGKCVRLTRGDFDSEKIYSEEPARVAESFAEAGATFIHMVDLDGARDGRRVNEEAIKAVTSAVNVPVELGGGIRTIDDAARCLDLGIARLVIGTKAVSDPKFVCDLIERFGPECVVVGVDAKDGLVAVEGWEKVSSVTVEELCLGMKEKGVRHIIFTDIERDGMLTGPNAEAVRELMLATGLDIAASGGVSCMEDLQSLYDAGLMPVIVQDYKNGQVLMMAYMNEQAYRDTLDTGLMHYYSRSRAEQWLKGETSGHFQTLKSLRLDCDNDTLLAGVDQTGAACHTGTRSCFFKKVI